MLLKSIKNSVYLMLACFSALSIQANELKAGEHYTVIASKPSQQQKITEYFNYGCGGCYKAEDFVNNWKKSNLPEGVEFELVPVELHAAWKIYVEAFYIAEMMGILDKTHTRMFHRIHVERKPIATLAELKKFYVSLGADSAEFDKVASSFQLSTKLRMAKKRAMSSRVLSTPAFTVNDYYLVNNKSFASYNDMLNGAASLSKL